MFDSPVDEIKSRLDIVEVIGSYIKLQKTGANYRAICPFHTEKRPSFFVSPSRQMWHCFGACGEGGDIFKFVMKIEGVEFAEALKILGQRAGVEIKKISPKIRVEKERLYEICELAAQFFNKQLESRAGQKAKEYLLNRGINEDSIKKWRIGYAPDVWQGLSDFLVSRGYKREEVLKVGLAVRKEEKDFKTYDRFRARIMFPIFNLNSQVVGFTGRIFGQSKEVAKYVNTPNTPLYDKSRVLYGLNKAKMAIRKEDKFILVEGQTDVIMSHQAGIENVVATSGTALTPFQLAFLKRYSENLITAFDMDLAGDSATKRGIDLAQSQEFNIKVIMMPGKDPADIVSESPEKWQELVKQTKSIMDFYFETTFARHDSKTVEGKKEVSKILLPVIKIIPNKIEQSYWVKQLAEKLEIKEEDIDIEMKKTKDDREDVFIQKEKGGQLIEAVKSKKQILEERILSLVLREKKNLSLIDDEFFNLFSDKTKEIMNILKEETDIFKREDVPDELKDYLNQLCFKTEMEDEEVEPEKEIKACLKELQFLEMKEKLNKICQEIKKAEQDKDSGKVDSLTKEFQGLCQLVNGVSENESSEKPHN